MTIGIVFICLGAVFNVTSSSITKSVMVPPADASSASTPPNLFNLVLLRNIPGALFHIILSLVLGTKAYRFPKFNDLTLRSVYLFRLLGPALTAIAMTLSL